ncbi:MAG: PAS domain S-box protein [Gemmatimonadales bacterium]
MEDALRESDAFHRLVLEEAPAGVLRLAPDGRVLYANAALQRQLGYGSRQEFQAIGPEHGVLVDESGMDRLWQAGELGDVLETRFRHREGTILPLVVRVSPRSPEDDAVTLVVTPARPAPLPSHSAGGRQGTERSG